MSLLAGIAEVLSPMEGGESGHIISNVEFIIIAPEMLS